MTEILDELVGAAVILTGLFLILRWNRKAALDDAPVVVAGEPHSDIGTAVLEALPDGVLVVNSSGVILMANRAAANMFALPYLEGLPVEKLIPEELRDRHRDHVRGYFDDPKSRPMGIGLPLEGVRGGGMRFPVDISLAPIQRSGGQAVAVIRDMTARHAAAKGHP